MSQCTEAVNYYPGDLTRHKEVGQPGWGVDTNGAVQMRFPVKL